VKGPLLLKKSIGSSFYLPIFAVLFSVATPRPLNATITSEKPSYKATANAVHTLALQHTSRCEYTRAEELFERALEMDEKAHGPNDPRVAVRLNNLALFYHDLGHYDRAEPLYERALAIHETAYGMEHPETARSLNNLGKLYYDRGYYKKAQPLYARALSIYENSTATEQASVAPVLNNQALLYQSLGDYGEAQSLFERVLAIEKKAHGNEHPAVAKALSNLASLYYERGLLREAQALYEEALSLDEAAYGKQHPEVAKDRSNLAAVHYAFGHYAQAKLLYEQAFTIDETVYGTHHPAVARDLNNLARLYAALGNFERSQSLYEQSLAIFEELYGPTHTTVALVLNNLAELYSRRGDYEKARSFLDQSLFVYKKVYGPKHPHVATAMNNLAGVHFASGEYTKAQALYEEALSIDEEIYGSVHPRVAIRLNNLAEVHLAMSRFDEAQKLYERALAVAQISGQPELLWRVQFNLGYLLAERQNPSAAIFFGKQAVNTIQKVRTEIAPVEKELQTSFLKTKWYVYQFLAGLLIDYGRLPEAQQILHMQKEEEYFEFLCRDVSRKDVRATKAAYTDEELQWNESYQELSERLISLGNELAELNDKKNAGLTGNQLKRYRELTDALTRTRATFGNHLARMIDGFTTVSGEEHAALRGKDLDRPKSLQQVLKKLAHGAVIIDYLITDDKLRIILTTGDLQVSRDVDISSKDLNSMIMLFRETLQNPRKPHLPQAKALYRIIVTPIDQDLRKAKAKTLMLSLDGTLRYLPVAALHDGELYLAERFQLAIYTPAAGMAFTSAPSTGWEVGGLGLSRAVRDFEPLPYVPAELEGIVRRSASDRDGVLPGVIYLDEAFSQAAFASVLKDKYSVVHIASHFELKPGTKDDSHLVFGDGSTLTLSHIRDGNFDFADVELLALSACNTAVGSRGPNGSEVESFGTLAQDQGAQGVLATLWPVADHSTGLLMQHFYRLHAENPAITKAEALHLAQLAFIRGDTSAANSPETTRGMKARPLNVTGEEGLLANDAPHSYTHPFYWAPFVLMGNWL
jgi:CHAT domain-containing protein/Tfp pilus assembly protein PilF